MVHCPRMFDSSDELLGLPNQSWTMTMDNMIALAGSLNAGLAMRQLCSCPLYGRDK